MKTLNDLTSPSPVVKRLLERDVQKQCVDWARARGYWARKFSSMTSASEPDYLFARQVGAARIKFATEFKRPGNVPTDAQYDELETMRQAGWLAFWCHDFELFKATVIQIEREHGVQI